MNVLSTIAILPENDRELETYVSLLKREILAHKDCKRLINNMEYASRAFKMVLEDDDIKKYISLPIDK